MKSQSQIKQLIGILMVTFTISPSLWADHGPGTSGGGSSTQSGETLKQGRFSFDYRFDFTGFENLSESRMRRNAAREGHFDVIDQSYLHSVSLSYGFFENFQAGLTIGHYDALNAREVEFDPGTSDFETVTFDPDGITDLWLSGKYRFYKGPVGQFALLGGVKFPTGRHHIRNSAGEDVEFAATAGSGSLDGMVGIAYSTWLTARLTLDTSAQYTLRIEHRDFKLGDRIDCGVAVSYRFNEDIQKYPQFNIFAEATLRHLYPVEEDGAREENTGGTTIFLSPGFRIGFCPNAALTIAPQFPVTQNLRGRQLETEFKIAASFNLTF